MSDAKDRLIISLDVPSRDSAMRVVESLNGSVRWVKVGSQLFTAEGPKVVADLKKAGFNVFLDLKFHDIPNTVASAGRSAVDLGVDLFNVHAMGGSAMMKKTVEELSSYCEKTRKPKPKIIAVTVLTSMNADDLKEIGFNSQPDEMVLRLARLAKESGLNGVVSSPWEVSAIKSAMGEGFLVVTPGVRPSWAVKDDQVRIKTPAEAIKEGADMLVVGRPVLKADNPADSANRIIDEINSALL
ncbi:Orotidine 5'-phosphate decarboxylase [hydrothermal vent metagenome]|uniref:Orotidine 5'-phosphate decarboxylase n=1 Tax=hydrothermal vent metagenome TaxID=652676 RepID=A0A3B1C2K6_9ZZZZ